MENCFPYDDVFWGADGDTALHCAAASGSAPWKSVGHVGRSRQSWAGEWWTQENSLILYVEIDQLYIYIYKYIHNSNEFS